MRSPSLPALIRGVLIARRYEVCTQADVAISMLSEEVISGKAMLTALLSKGVEKALMDVINSTTHLYEERSEVVDSKTLPCHVVDTIFLSIMLHMWL